MKTTKLPKTASELTDPYHNLFSVWQRQPFVADSKLVDYACLGNSNQALGVILGDGPCITWVLDIRTQQFVFISDNTRQLIGYDSGIFRKDGFCILNKLMHPEDKKLLAGKTLKLWENMLLLPAARRQSLRFSRKYRIRKPDGSFICLLEQNKVLQTDANGNITHVLGTCTDITELVNLRNFEATVQVPVSKVANRPTSGEEQTATNIKLSEREKEIVRLVAEGYSSKLIADQLFISFHTVNTHRKNIICKTHSRNTSGLVQYAINNRII